MLEVAVSKQLGRVALDTAFRAEAGQVTALFGRSGSGKTSTVNMVAGLLRPDAGRIVLDGDVLFDGAARRHLPPERRRIGYVFQDSRLFPHLNVRGNLLYGQRRGPARDRYVDLDHVVEMLDIGALLPRRPADLSGGERQRVAIGRALLTSPRLLLMDEPLASLDGGLKAEILPYLERLRDDMRLPILYVSHAIDEVVRLAGRMVVLSDGRVAAAGSVDEVMNRIDLRPLTGRYEAGSVIDGRAGETDPGSGLTRIEFMDGEGSVRGQLLVPDLGLSSGERLRVRVRARDVSLALTPPVDSSIQNMLPAVVTALSAESGPIVDVALDAGVPLSARITRASAERLGLRPGRPVHALIKGIALDRHSLGLPSRRGRPSPGDGEPD